MQAAYSTDFDQALENVVFFYVPFALLFALLVPRAVDARGWPRRCLGVLAALAVVFAGIGFVEYATRHLLLNPKVIASNQFESYFRVNSLFFDPNIYGRFLAVVMLGLAAVLLWAQRARDVVLARGAARGPVGGAVLTLSQSCFAALLVGLAVLGGAALEPARARSPWRGGAGGRGRGARPRSRRRRCGSTSAARESADDATSGRYELVEGGVELFADAPLRGPRLGLVLARVPPRGGRLGRARASRASHTIPVTVAAEQGVLGLALYLALLAAGASCGSSAAPRGDPARAAVAAAFAALVVHTCATRRSSRTR